MFDDASEHGVPDSVLSASPALGANSFAFTPIDVPPTFWLDADKTEAYGINTVTLGVEKRSEIVGWYEDKSGYDHGFLFAQGTYTAIDYYLGPGHTEATGINNFGQIVGWYTGTDGRDHGCLLTPGHHISIDYPGAFSTHARGINNVGQIVGHYDDGTSHSHGFLFADGSYMRLDYPGAILTWAYGINDHGHIVGSYWGGDPSYPSRGFLLREGSYTSIDCPSALGWTEAYGINNFGQIVGWYYGAPSYDHHGFLLSEGSYTSIDYPGGHTTQAFGINDPDRFGSYRIVGRYIGKTNDKPHGFLATSPATIVIWPLAAEESLTAPAPPGPQRADRAATRGEEHAARTRRPGTPSGLSSPSAATSTKAPAPIASHRCVRRLAQRPVKQIVAAGHIDHPSRRRPPKGLAEMLEVEAARHRTAPAGCREQASARPMVAVWWQNRGRRALGRVTRA